MSSYAYFQRADLAALVPIAWVAESKVFDASGSEAYSVIISPRVLDEDVGVDTELLREVKIELQLQQSRKVTVELLIGRYSTMLLGRHNGPKRQRAQRPALPSDLDVERQQSCVRPFRLPPPSRTRPNAQSQRCVTLISPNNLPA